jgi:catechol 2,3-dioxygenase-like lactoylglutathione lyase family enzyme
MEFHFGRLIDHIHLVTANLAASKRFYSAVLNALGRKITHEFEHAFASDELFISDAEFVGPDGTHPHRIHLAFQAKDRATVERFHRAGLEAGGRDNGAPRERSNYHPGYFGAFLLDPDGNNIEAVHHGPAKRSAESILITPDG